MTNIPSLLRRIKSELNVFLSEQAVDTACRRCGYCRRDRLPGSVQTIHLFILQLLNFNTAMNGGR
jgi:hypothetical protein